MRNRLAGVVLVSALLLLVTASPASALTKVRSPLALTTDPVVIGGFCPFPITYQDISGSRFSANGNTVVANNSGPVSVFPQPDGTDRVILRGRSFAADQGLITGEPFFALTAGRAIVVSRFNPQTGFNDFLSFDPVGNVTDLCDALAA
jgi:hypothetical protein